MPFRLHHVVSRPSFYFDATGKNPPAFYRFRISDPKRERVIDLKAYRLFPGQFSAPWTGLAPGDAPLFVRDISTSEIYAFDIDSRRIVVASARGGRAHARARCVQVGLSPVTLIFREFGDG